MADEVSGFRDIIAANREPVGTGTVVIIVLYSIKIDVEIIALRKV